MKPVRAKLPLMLGGLFFFSIALLFGERPAPVRTEAMTFNIRLGVAKDGDNHWDKRHQMVYAVINDRKPDFCGLQEAWKFQLDAILENVPGYAFVGRSRQADPNKGEWCPLLYRTDRWDVVESGTFWLSDTPEKEASMSWGNGIPRICTWARLKEKGESGFVLDVYNTHFDHQSQPSREKSADLIAKKIFENTGGAPFVVLGDFNAGEDNPAMARFREDLRIPMDDTFRVAHPDAKETGTFGGWKGRKDGAKIDGVFLPRGLGQVVEASIIHDNEEGRYPSDHYPVDAVIKWLPWDKDQYKLRTQWREEIAQATQLIAEAPENPRLWMHRGILRFYDAEIEGSIADFDEFLKLVPDAEPRHWQRGLSYYYAGEFEKGARQFETHHKVNPDDVENSAWHLACVVMAKESTLAEASGKIIPTRGDSRVPMMEIHKLYAGQGSEEEVLKACGDDRNALCFGHLYLGLWNEIQGNDKKAKEHILKSAIDYQMDHYMGTVSVVHARLRGWYFPD